MLDCSGFFNPLQMTSEEKHPCTYLRAGRHKVINRKINHAETPALQTFYDNINISDNIEIFHHAETTKGMYRDCTVEGDHQRESACIVHYCNYVGRISYFFRHSCSGTMHELSWINWIGHLRKRRREPMLLCGEDRRCSKSCCWSTRAIRPVNLFVRGWDHVDPIFVVIKNLKQCWSCVYFRNTVKPVETKPWINQILV